MTGCERNWGGEGEREGDEVEKDCSEGTYVDRKMGCNCLGVKLAANFTESVYLDKIHIQEAKELITRT